MSSKEELAFSSAWELRQKLLSQEITSVELTELFIERIEIINPKVNAYCTTSFDIAREMAKEADYNINSNKKIGLLHGIPTSIKDLMKTKDIRTTYGSKLYENFIPDQDDIAVRRLKDSGCVILGKTNTPEFGHVALTDNLIFGETKNPWDTTRNSGGSSGGAASSVASGLGPLALGSDGGGSIRVPSSLCGVFGLKPTFGRIPRYPPIGITFWDMDHYGPIVRYVKDAALMLEVMKGPHPNDKNAFPDDGVDFVECVEETPKFLKIGYSLDLGFFRACDEEVKNKVTQAANLLTKFDWQIEEVKLKVKKPEYAFSVLVPIGYAYDLKKAYEEQPENLSSDLKNIINAGLSFEVMDIGKATEQRMQLYNAFHEYFKQYDILITPTTPIPAFKVEKTEHGIRFPKIGRKAINITSWMSFTYPFNMTGLPAASIPCGWSEEGLPIGMQIIGKRYDEKTVLQVAKAFEEVSPWQVKKPNLI